MNKKLIQFLIVCICISLVGMIIVQFFWIRNAFKVKEALFNRSVNEALGNVVEKMETHENMYFISRNFEGDSILQIVKEFSRDSTTQLMRGFDSLKALSELPVASAQPKREPQTQARRHNRGQGVKYTYKYNVQTLDGAQDTIHVDLEQFITTIQPVQGGEFRFNWEDQEALLDSLMEAQDYPEFFRRRFMMNQAITRNGQEIIITSPGFMDPGILRFGAPQGMPMYPPPRSSPDARARQMVREDNLLKLENKARKIQDMIKQMAIALETKPAPVQQRINKTSLQNSLKKALSDKGIDIPFEFAVFSPDNTANHYPIRSNGFQNEHQNTNHRISLFPNDLFQKPDLLLLHFSGERALVFKSLSWLLASSLLFTLIIAATSGASIVVMIRQKKISDIKTDFINNMTHEFKTPIATISIAADSISNPRVLNEPETIRNFTRIIKEENNRMNTRVEQVLQMALLDSKDFKLRPSLVNMNDLIQRIVDHYKLQIEKREGSLVTQLEATADEVPADEDHIRNVILNLLDNANKYSVSKPEILIRSYNRAGKYYFCVHDHGMGMSQDVQQKVFDKFYRVTTGNIHNIKGFGLGLSYVKAIVLAHHGEVRIESEPGKGSKFEIGLPIRS